MTRTQGLPFVFTAATLAAWIGCAPEESKPNLEPGGEASVNSARQELMAAGMERIIPIRYTMLLACEPGPGCADSVTQQNLLRDVQRANQAFVAAGVQFYIEAIDRVRVPWILASIDASEPPKPDGTPGDLLEFAFAGVRDELKKIFPAMPLDAWDAGETKSTRVWLHAANAFYEDVRHMHVWIGPPGVTSSGAYPEAGRGIFFRSNHVGSSVFAHEAGHFFGLRHTFEGDFHPDPETLANRKLSDRWDLVYSRGSSVSNPHRFYASRADAEADEATLELMDKDGNCTNLQTPVAGTLSCTLPGTNGYSETHQTTEPSMRGLAFSFAGGARGVNAMKYDRPSGPVAFSDSQVEIIRKYLRWDVPYRSLEKADYVTGYQYTPGNLGSRRTRLGHVEAAAPVEQLDFDRDDLRDIAYWVPPTSSTGLGRVVALLSSNAFSTAVGQFLSVSAGGLGDIPVPADYDGNGSTDVAFYQPGGGENRDDLADTNAWWRWCPTAANAELTACPSNPPTLQWGRRYDTPQPGLEFDGNASADFSVYRPLTGTWHFRNLSGTLNDSKSIGVARGGIVPLAGLYDCDAKSDLAVYEPSSAKFKLLRSEQSWNTPTEHQFDSRFVPYPTGDDEERAVPLALAGFTTRRTCGSVVRTRRAAALFYPEDATWNILWDPTSSGTSVLSCPFGSGSRDQPIVGLDRNLDRRTDLALFRAPSASTQEAYVRTRVTGSGTCDGDSLIVPCLGCSRPRARVWAVRDMTGDGRAEIMSLDPYVMTVRWLTSESDYTVSVARSLDDPRAIVF